MQNFFKSDKGIIILLILCFFLILPFFYLHQGLLLIDTGREFYIPQQILNGELLYKNIFNIYGALSYQFNALLFAIFGQKITTLYWAGILNSLLIIVSLYMLAREFLNKNLSALYFILIMFALVFQTFLYNSNLTYSFAIVYALSSFIFSLLFLIKYIKNDKPLFAYIACLFAGISIANKYEFSLYPFILIYVFLFLKPLGLKNTFKAITAFLFIPVISYGTLLIQGLNISDIKQSAVLLNNLINAPTLKLFFSKFGVFFDINGILSLIQQNKIFSIFGMLPFLTLVLLVINFKKIHNNNALFVFILCAIFAAAKAFFFLNVKHMGIFIFPTSFLAVLILISHYKEKIMPIILSACILLFAADTFSSIQYKNYLLTTSKGNIYSFKKDAQPIEQVTQYILNNTKDTDKIVVLPEGSIINFLTDRTGDNFYYNLSPLFYNDVFGEQRIINDFKQNLPEYFVILPINNIEYGNSFFGIDYAQNFYEMIITNYNLVENQNNIKIYKRKNI